MFVPLLTSSPDNNVPSDGHDNLRDLDEFYDGTSSAVYTNANAVQHASKHSRDTDDLHINDKNKRPCIRDDTSHHTEGILYE